MAKRTARGRQGKQLPLAFGKNGEYSRFKVRSTSADETHRTITLSNGKNQLTKIRTHRFALVGPGDTVLADPHNAARLSVVSTENENDLIPVTPHFSRETAIRLGAVDYQIQIRELTTPEDIKEYEYLEGFHYKTSSSIVSDDNESEKAKSVGGRKAILIAYLQVGRRFLPAGYVELQMPLLMVKPRHVLFDRGFHHPTRDIAWDHWDQSAMRKYVNAIVRIARLVTSPDFRGLGLARVLIDMAREFSRERWHVSGKRPLFMEISAEMLKYMDFVSSAGFHLVGNTEGNLERVHQDLHSMRRGYAASFGIMTLQKKYLNKLERIAAELGKPLDKVLNKLRELTENKTELKLRATLNKMKPQEWYLYKTVLRFPIPYFMCGLDESSEEFIRENANAAVQKATQLFKPSASARIDLRDIKVTSAYRIPDSGPARAIRDCFGLSGDLMRVCLVGPVSIQASGGNIILITGPSGSGKSVLMKVLDPQHRDDTLLVSSRQMSGSTFEVAWLNALDDSRPLIEYFTANWGMEDSISALNLVGLSEAFVYLRPYSLLSRGQQYRARLAALSLGRAPVWLMDEFCADLDPFTAKVVANNLRKTIIRSGRIAIVAAANNAHYIDALRPTRVIYLRHNGRSEVLTYKEYVDEFCVACC